jgi:hypothetical protein
VASVALPAKCSPAPGTSISFETLLVLLPVTVTGEHGAFSNHEKRLLWERAMLAISRPHNGIPSALLRLRRNRTLFIAYAGPLLHQL